jgi:hypothetical protein
MPAEELLEFGLKRIERFVHVGTTEKLHPSVESAAASLQMPLGGTAYGAGEVRCSAVQRDSCLLVWFIAGPGQEGGACCLLKISAQLVLRC